MFIYPPPAFRTPFPLMSFPTEEITGCTNEAAKGANKASRNQLSCCFILSFPVSVTSAINTCESSNDFITFLIWIQ